MYRKHANKKGFTLIELLIVVGVLGILAVGVISIINPFEQLAKGRDTKRKTDLASVQKALELYYQDNGRYPASTASSGEILPAGSPVAAAWGSNGFAPYMANLPKDAISTKRYFYRADATGQTYWIFASLERWKNDSQVCSPGTNTACAKATGLCGTSTDTCNFGVSSPNDSPN